MKLEDVKPEAWQYGCMIFAETIMGVFFVAVAAAVYFVLDIANGWSGSAPAPGSLIIAAAALATLMVILAILLIWERAKEDAKWWVHQILEDEDEESSQLDRVEGLVHTVLLSTDRIQLILDRAFPKEAKDEETNTEAMDESDR